MINVKDFGAKGDNAADDTAAFSQAINAANGEFVYVPPGWYRVSYVTTDKPIKLVGTGWQTSQIRSLTPDQDIFTTTSTGQCFYEKLGFGSDIKRSGGAYVKFDTAVGSNFGTRISECNFDNGGVGVDFVDAAGWIISGCYFTNYRTAVQIANQNMPDAGDSTITECIFDAGGPSGVGILQWSSGGLRVTNNKFLNGDYQYLGQFDSLSSTSILIISGNSFEWASLLNIALTSRNRTTFSHVVIDGNELSVSKKATAILVQDPGYEFLNSAVIGNNIFNLADEAKGIVLARGKALTISTNTFVGNGDNTGISFMPQIGSAYVLPQNMQFIMTKYAGVNSKVVFPVKP